MKEMHPEHVFKSSGGQLRMSEALEKGLSRYMLYKLKERNIIELPSIGNPDLVTVSLRIPKAVICLVSALSWHELTTQIPHAVSIALPRNTNTPVLDYPIVSVHRFSEVSYSSGIEKHRVDSIMVRIYCAEKTIADCFKYRNQLGMDLFLEALKKYSLRKKRDYDGILRYAQINRVENLIRPYLEVSSI
jgi:predicted transcriptional regulator of viral defense system